MKNFDVYVIHSNKTIADIKESIRQCGEEPIYVGIIYKTFDLKGSKQETKKTIIFCSKETKEKLEKIPEYEGNIEDYDWKSFPIPRVDMNETYDLHISGIPNDYTVKDAENYVESALSCLLPKDGNYQTEFPLRSRQSGEIHGYGHIKFNNNVDIETIKHCKLILHNKLVAFKNYPDKKIITTCVWHRVPQTGIKNINKDKNINKNVKIVNIPTISFTKGKFNATIKKDQ
ncbi:MAG: hypothetical protein QW478_00565 [Candidatus Micrarchaeaceae archaeon]